MLDEKGISIEPGITGMIDGEKVFPSLTVTFSKDGKSVAQILDTGTGNETPKAKLEPKQLSTIAAEGDGRRKTVTFNDLPQHLIKAITVTEDRAFFEHYGVNFRGIARALWRRYEGEENTPLSNQGGSSITQQLVKNLLLTNAPTLERKVTEAFMSVILETRLTKQEIFSALRKSNIFRPAIGRFDIRRRRGVECIFRQRRFAADVVGRRFYCGDHPQPKPL